MRVRSVAPGVLIVALLSVIVSYLKFARCIGSSWTSPDVYSLGCYTDITSLYQARGFSKDIWPYGSGSESFEYPILSGLGIWLLSLVTSDGPKGLLHFFINNILAISAFYLYLMYLLSKIEKRSALLLTLSPAVISALFINWDIWAIAPMVASFYLLQKERNFLSGALLSISISLKFFPIIFVIPVILLLRQQIPARNRFLQGLIMTTLIVNVPFMVTEFTGWSKFYIFNYHRGVDFGSIWYLFSLKGSWINHLNWIVTPLIGALLVFIYSRYRESFVGCTFMSAAIFFTLNKVYSPQYVLWLVVLALLFFPKNKIFVLLFSLWQASELAYQYAIWHHILQLKGAVDGISTNSYIGFSALRVITFVALTGYGLYLLENNLMKSRRSESNRQTDLFAHLRRSS